MNGSTYNMTGQAPKNVIWPNTKKVHHETPKVISFLKCYIWANGDHQGLPILLKAFIRHTYAQNFF